MYVALLPVWGRRYVNATHSGASVALFDDENARVYGEFLGERFRSQPNIIWVLGGDVKAVQPDLQIDKRSTYRAMAEGIALGVTTKHMAWNEPDDAWDEVLMTYHPDGDPKRNSSDWFHEDPWLDFNMIETHVHRDEVYDAVARDYALADPVQPTVMAEPQYEGYTRDALAEAIHMRRQAYQTFFAGGAGFTYGAHHLRPGNRGPLFSPYGDWKPMLQLEGARSLPLLKQFLTEQRWFEWVPDARLVEAPGRGEMRIVAVRVPNRQAILAYFPTNRRAVIKLPDSMRDDTMALTWFDTASGKQLLEEASSSSRRVTLTPPDAFDDAVAVLAPTDVE